MARAFIQYGKQAISRGNTLNLCRASQKIQTDGAGLGIPRPGMLDNQVQNPPTYACYLKLCWDFINRQARQQNRDQLLGRSNNVTAAAKTGALGRPAGSRKEHYDHRVEPAAGAALPSQDPKGKQKGKPRNDRSQPRAASNRSDPGSKLCKEKGWCYGYFKYGQCLSLIHI